MGKRRKLFFKEQSFVLQGTDIIRNFDLQSITEDESPGKLLEVTSPDSISMSVLLGWEEVMPSLASQASHRGRRKLCAVYSDSDYSEKVEEMKEATDSTDTNYAQSSQQSFSAGQVHIRNHSFLTLHEAVYVNSHMKECEPTRDANGRADIHCQFNVDETTEYGKRLIQVSGELRAYEEGLSAITRS